MNDELDDMLEIADLSIPEDFERVIPNLPTPPMTLTYEKVKVAGMLAFGGQNTKQIAEATKIPETTIKKWMKNPEFINYKNSIVIKSMETVAAENISLISKVINARVANLEKEGKDYADLSNKDLAQLIELRNTLIKNEKKEEDSSYSKKLEELLIKSSQRNVIDITPGGNKVD